MYKVVFVNGGAGRMICALPALERFIQENPDGYIVTEGGIDFVWGHPTLQDRTFDSNHKGLFENILKDGEIITTEPYRDNDYYNQRISIAQAFDKQINGNYREDFDYKPAIFLNKEEDMYGLSVVMHAKAEQKKNKTIVLQPYGRSSTHEHDLGLIVDTSSRSLEMEVFNKIVDKLSLKYNLLLMSEHHCETHQNLKVISPKDLTLRKWCAVVDNADYFIGCDSVGQHFAYSMGTPGSIVLGSTFAVNVSYPKYFNIIEKQSVDKRYSPIRITEYGCYEADRINDRLMDFSGKELETLIDSIVKHISKKVGE